MSYIENIRKKVGHDAIFLPGSGCVIVNNNKILLQKRADNNTWALHGGYLELGETCLEALNREVKEEINVIPIDPEFFKVYSGEDFHVFYPNKDEVYSVITLYIVKEYLGDLKPDNNEVLELKWFDFNNLPENINKCDLIMINDVISYYS